LSGEPSWGYALLCARVRTIVGAPFATTRAPGAGVWETTVLAA
jgi:hypothetical protein